MACDDALRAPRAGRSSSPPGGSRARRRALAAPGSHRPANRRLAHYAERSPSPSVSLKGDGEVAAPALAKLLEAATPHARSARGRCCRRSCSEPFDLLRRFVEDRRRPGQRFGFTLSRSRRYIRAARRFSMARRFAPPSVRSRADASSDRRANSASTSCRLSARRAVPRPSPRIACARRWAWLLRSAPCPGAGSGSDRPCRPWDVQPPVGSSIARMSS